MVYMVRVKYRESGEVWELDGHLTSRFVRQRIKDVRWYRQWFPENVHPNYSQLEIYLDDTLDGFITITDYWIAYTRWDRLHDFSNFARCLVERRPTI